MVSVNTPIGVSIVEGSLGEFYITHENNMSFLRHNDKQLMCLNNTNFAELYDQQPFYDLAYGKVLLSGFGFGLAPVWLAQKESVEEIWVVESHLETVQLFMRHNVMPSKVRIIHGAIDDYVDTVDCLFLDHFPDLQLNNLLPQVKKIGANITHNVGWYYTAELQYLRDMYKVNLEKLMTNGNALDTLSIGGKWGDYVQAHEPFKLPIVEESALRNYAKNFCTIPQ